MSMILENTDWHKLPIHDKAFGFECDVDVDVEVSANRPDQAYFTHPAELACFLELKEDAGPVFLWIKPSKAPVEFRYW